MTQYEITHSSFGASECFPVGYDKSNLINVSRVGDYWATFLDPRTGAEVSCEDFYKQMEIERKKLL